MLEEKLILLEERISAMLSEVKTLREEKQALQEENKQLRIKTQEEIDMLTMENEDLQKKIKGLEGDISANSDKEQEIRERLRNIIEKIDAIEQMSGQE